MRSEARAPATTGGFLGVPNQGVMVYSHAEYISANSCRKSVMASPLTETSRTDVQSFWDRVHIWPLQFERSLARRWPLLILVPYGLVSIYASVFMLLLGRRPPALGAGYLFSLGLALLGSGPFFKVWEGVFRDALGSLYIRNCVSETPPASYLPFSMSAAAWFRSR